MIAGHRPAANEQKFGNLPLDHWCPFKFSTTCIYAVACSALQELDVRLATRLRCRIGDPPIFKAVAIVKDASRDMPCAQRHITNAEVAHNHIEGLAGNGGSAHQQCEREEHLDSEPPTVSVHCAGAPSFPLARPKRCTPNTYSSSMSLARFRVPTSIARDSPISDRPLDIDRAGVVSRECLRVIAESW